VPAGDYWVGLAFFAATIGGCLGAAWLVVARRLVGLTGSTRWLAWGLIATAAVLVAHLVPAALTILTRETAALAGLALLAGASRLPRAAAPPVGYPEPARAPTETDRMLARFGVLAFGIWVVLVALKQLYAEPLGFDAVNAYLPTAANWLQDGSIWGLEDWIPGFFFGAAPGNGTAILLAATLPWENDFVTHFAIYPFVAMTAVAVYGLAREATAPPPAAALLGVMVTAIPVVVFPALRDALLDPVLYATFAAGLLFLARHRRTGRNSDLLLAGLGLGIAFGTKFYGFTAVPIVVAVWLGARAWAGTRGSALARQAALLIAPIVLFGGLWVARNWIATGNPAYPVEVSVLGVELFDAPADPLRERLGTSLAEYFDEPSVWSNELREQFRVAAGLPLALLAVAVAVTFAFLVRRRGLREDDESDGPALCGVVLTAALALSYALTPYSATGAPGEPFLAAANVRYGIPALIVAGAVAGWLSGRLGRLALTVSCALGVAGMFDALRVGVLTPRSTVYAAFALAAAALAVAWLVRRRPQAALPAVSRRPVIGGVAVLVIAVAVFGSRAQRTYNDTRYLGQDEVLSALADSEALRVGLAGNWTAEEPGPVYPAFGRRLQNRVQFAGVTEDGLLRRAASRQEFVAALRGGSFDALIVGLDAPTPEDPVALLSRTAEDPAELAWARSAGFEETMRSERFALLLAGERGAQAGASEPASTNSALPRSASPASG
jgi:4-amino-4-deoxy-L-arabinose transferase-like glycosyltransferase